ncbi:MAG: DUF3842 family protein [Oscillospiraceae bacterium]
MNIVIIDGQGGKMGAALTRQFLEAFPKDSLISIGTNSMATAAMLKAGAPRAATGENPVLVAAKTADLIVGPIGIMSANALLGEITPKMAAALSESNAQKLLLPVNKCAVTVVGAKELSLTDAIREAIVLAKAYLSEEK